MQHDHVCAMYRDHKRSAAGFEWSDCILMDCDNDHSEDPAQWKHPEDVVTAFPNVTFAVCYSRNHMKEKHGRPARPKFHCYFPVEMITDSNASASLRSSGRESGAISSASRKNKGASIAVRGSSFGVK